MRILVVSIVMILSLSFALVGMDNEYNPLSQHATMDIKDVAQQLAIKITGNRKPASNHISAIQSQLTHYKRNNEQNFNQLLVIAGNEESKPFHLAQIAFTHAEQEKQQLKNEKRDKCFNLYGFKVFLGFMSAFTVNLVYYAIVERL